LFKSWCDTRLAASNAHLFQSVEFARHAREQRRFFGNGAASADALEGIPQCRIAEAALVDREITLEHRALVTKGGNAGLNKSLMHIEVPSWAV
jgi:hypothetical protein